MTRLIITIVENGDDPKSMRSVVIEETENGWAIDNTIEEYEVGSLEEALDELKNTINEIKLLGISGQTTMEVAP